MHCQDHLEPAGRSKYVSVIYLLRYSVSNLLDITLAFLLPSLWFSISVVYLTASENAPIAIDILLCIGIS